MSLKVGDKAPEFSSFNQNGENISLKNLPNIFKTLKLI